MRVVLLGDSVLDNHSYVPEGQSVHCTFVSKKPEWSIKLHAIDGHCIGDVVAHQLYELDRADFIVVSAGGNDLLANVDILRDDNKTTTVKAFSVLRRLVQGFELKYELMLHSLVEQGATPANIAVCTVYYPNMENTPLIDGYQTAAEAAVDTFNGAIYRLAKKYGVDLIELRDIFTEPADYANPIEPSARGGRKLVNVMISRVKPNEQ